MTHPIVSILIPTHNRPARLARALASLQTQNYPHWQALVIDDGDRSGLELARSLSDPRIQPHPNRGKGQVDARNFALEWAQGEYLALLDDDDWWQDVDHLDQVVQRLQQGPALVYRTGWLVREGADQPPQWIPFDHQATAESLRHNNTLLGSSIAYPREFHQEFGLFDGQISDYWDWDWYLRVTPQYPLYRIPGRGVAIGVHGKNTSYGGRRAERQAALDRLCHKHGLSGITLKDHQDFIDQD